MMYGVYDSLILSQDDVYERNGMNDFCNDQMLTSNRIFGCQQRWCGWDQPLLQPDEKWLEKISRSSKAPLIGEIQLHQERH